MSFTEAFILLTIPEASLTTPSSTYTGALALEYVTFSTPSAAPSSRDVVLVLRIASLEVVLDPARTLTLSVLPSGQHKYVFHSTPQDPAELLLTLPAPHAGTADDIDLFHSVLAEYGNFRGDFAAVETGAADVTIPVEEKAGPEDDLRGRFILVDEDNGEVIGALDNHVRVREDASLNEKGEEKAPVVVELPEGADALDDLQEVEVLVRTVPKEERDWMMKGAVFVTHVIAGGTTLLTSAMSSASNYYIAHSTPSPHATPSGTLSPSKDTLSVPGSASGSRSGSPAPPSRTLLLLQSPTTRKNLTRVHAVSGHAAKLSNKTTAVVEGLIERMVGAESGKGKGKAGLAQPGSQTDKPPLPSRNVIRAPSPLPPPYSAAASEKPPLPPRRSPAPSRSTSPLPPHASPSTMRLVDAGGVALGAAVTHKYGAQAGENVGIAAGAARNVTLVYVDMRGLGRRAIVKKVAKGWVKGQAHKLRHGEKQ
ncbi:hypothetical protein FA95DRAFT_1559479 [Auriscalpium vulgare]|uniref:Uncharacterized protein n=1 Tax=Auriscalpium vulgare TaxID=40419 RepID=A0ACB8RSV4_9AGAM|nr:hypothetical protein FA95DRAFT_1559479 [Auriscalpium vulgare]